MNHATLKARQRAERHHHPTNLALRAHRALSWLERAEQTVDDPDSKFIFLWIAFNAAYATQIDERYRLSEQATFQAFLEKLLSLDTHEHFKELVWTEFSGGIRVLLDNPYVFQDFWNFHNGSLSEGEWKARFERANAAARSALGKQDTQTILGIVLSRMYTLRNQLMHGGATWNSAVNRDQIRDCVNLLSKIVPLVIELMLDHPETLWGDACYPVVKES